MRTSTLKTRLLLGFGAAAVLLGMPLFLWRGATLRMADAELSLGQVQQTLQALDTLQRAWMSAEESACGYLISPLPRYRDAFYSDAARIERHQHALALQLILSTEQRRRMQALRRVMNARMAALNRIVDRKRRGASSDAMRVLTAGAVDPGREPVESALGAIRREEELRHRLSTAAGQSAAGMAMGSFYVLAFVVPCLLLALYHLLTHEVLGRRAVHLALRQQEEAIEFLIRERTEELTAGNRSLALELEQWRRSVEERESMHRSRIQILDTVDVALVGVDAEGIVTFLNAAASACLGWSAGELCGRGFHTSLQYFRADHVFYPADQSDLLAAIKAGLPYDSSAEVLWKRDGSALRAALVSRPLKQAESLIGAILSIRPDTDHGTSDTARLRTEAALAAEKTARKRLEEQVAALYEDRARIGAEADAADAVLLALQSALSQDLRCPLNVVTAACAALENCAGMSHSEEERALLGELRSGSDRLQQRLDDLNALFLVAEASVRWGPVDLSALAHSAADRLRLAPATGNQCVFVIADGLEAPGDRALLEIALERLMSIACQLSAGLESARIEFGISERNGKSVHFVRAENAGFEMIEGEAAAAALRRLIGDTGCRGIAIDFALVEQVIRRHNGRISVESRQDRGTTFSFSF